MVVQRILDLAWMGQGACRVGQAQFKLVSSQLNLSLQNCSVLHAVQGSFPGLNNQEEHKKQKKEAISEELDVTFKDVDDEASQIEKEHMASLRKESMGTTTTQKREFSTCTNCYHLKHQSSYHNRTSKTSISHFHTSFQRYAITAEELAKIEKIAKKNQSSESFGKKKYNLKQELNERSREKRVPSSRAGRVASFGGLAAGLMMGTVSEMAKKTFSGEQFTNTNTTSVETSAFLSDANLERIVNTLCRVRGAALKLGQMLSIQDDSIVDPKFLQVFDRVRQSADFMPVSQMKKVLVQQLGQDWQEKLSYFEDKPFAAASIGQVHRAVLHDGREVAMKIQYPGVADSINSDINNLVTLLKFYNFFPEKFYIDKFIDVARKELSEECDYEREAMYFNKFRDLLKDDHRYHVPAVIPELSTKRVITTEMIIGMPLDKVTELDQESRNYVAKAMLHLLMREIFEFHTMQTDPNWANFFYNPETRKINLLDFGASREYPKEFVDDYIEVVYAASNGNRDTVLKKSRSLKFLTGYEAKVMEEAHVDAVMILGEPFSEEGEFDFSVQDTTKRIAKLVPKMLEHRLTAPPEESYSLHRKLSGGFFLASKLKSKFACRDILIELYNAHHERVRIAQVK